MSLNIEPISQAISEAQKYLDLGWAVVPVRPRSKAVEIPDWTERSFSIADLEAYARRAGGLNVGVKLGAPSGGLVDIDVDAPEALIPARAWLPEGAWIFGRPGKPGSHYLYYSAIPRRIDFRDRLLAGSKDPEQRKKAMLLEIRANGQQTVFPPSVHESGEPIRWEAQPGERPAAYEPDLLIGLARKVAAAALLARYWPGQGLRHDAALALGGVLARAGWVEEAAEDFVRVVALAAGDDEPEDRARAARDSVIRYRAGETVTGIPRLAEYLPEGVLKQVLEWLGITDAPHTKVASLARQEDMLVSEALNKLMDIEDILDPENPYSVLKQDDIITSLAILSIFAQADYQEIRHKIKKAAKKAINLRELDRLVKTQAARILAEQRNASMNRPVREVLPDLPKGVPPIIEPDRFEIAEDGVYLLKEKEGIIERINLIGWPLIIIGRYRDIDDRYVLFRLAWRDEEGWDTAIVDRGQVLDRNKIIPSLAPLGAPVSSKNAADVVWYLEQFERVNASILEKRPAMSRMGWSADRKMFLLGRTIITADKSIDVSDDRIDAPVIFWSPFGSGIKQITEGYRTAGTIEGWIEAIRPLANYPKPKIALYASAAAPLLEIIGAPNFIVDFAGRTSTGKTTTLRVAASMWGNPDERSPAAAISTWDTTHVWVERTGSTLHSIPLILDDTKRARDPKVIADILYSVASGRGRTRGTIRGVGETRTWRTVLISSGENAAVTYTQDGGTRGRTLEIVGLPFGGDGPETGRIVDEIDRGIREHFGHAGRVLVKFLLTNREAWTELKQSYDELTQHYAAHRNSVARRLAKSAAAITVAAMTLHEAMRSIGHPLPWEFADPFADLWEEIAEAAESAPPEIRALEAIISYSREHEQAFLGRHRGPDDEPIMPAQGWLGYWPKEEGNKEWEIAFFPNALRKTLEELGFEPDAVIDGWYERGWLVTDGDRRRKTKRIKVMNNLVRMIAIKRDVFLEPDI